MYGLFVLGVAAVEPLIEGDGGRDRAIRQGRFWWMARLLVVCGLATNICCFFVARDLRKAGFNVYMVEDASAGIDVPAAGLFQEKAKKEGEQMGIRYSSTEEILSQAGSTKAV